MKNVWVGTLILWLMSSHCVMAIQPMTLSDASLIGLDGQPYNLTAVALPGQWVLLYVQSNCQPCERALQALKKKEDHPDLAPRLVIVLGGAALADLQLMAKKFPDLAQARFYLDSSKALPRTLKLSGAPVALEIRHQTVMLGINGVVPDPKVYTNVLTAWTTY